MSSGVKTEVASTAPPCDASISTLPIYGYLLGI